MNFCVIGLSLKGMSEEFVEDMVTVESIFVRTRNCLLLRGRFSPLFVGYYLYAMQHRVEHENSYDSIFKELLAYFTLFLTACPWAEQHAWTINLKQPGPSSLFVTGSSLTHSVVGRVFTQGIRDPEHSLMYAQMYRDNQKVRSSTILIDGDQPGRWLESYFTTSEQRLSRCFELADEHFALITAQPDADEEWLQKLTPELMSGIDTSEELHLLETRRFDFLCGCTIDRIVPMLKVLWPNPDELFEGQDHVEVSCPRCGAVYLVTRAMMESEPDSGR